MESQQTADECSFLVQVHWDIFAHALFEDESVCHQYRLQHMAREMLRPSKKSLFPDKMSYKRSLTHLSHHAHPAEHEQVH